MPTNALAPPARNAMLRPYAPSWREQIEAYFMGDSRPSPERRQFAQGLTSILGLVPGVGSVLQAQEAAQSGDRKGVAMAMLPIPGAARAGAVAKAVEREAPHIIAYHGSPHSFDRFDMSKIGTGEGAQAYGHGLYFAQNEDVAKQYREFLSSRTNDLTDPGNLAASLYYRTPEGTREAAIREAQTVLKSIDRMPAAYQHDPGVRERTQKALELLQSGAELPKQGGSMYQVRINADPEHFLDWDKPLSEQPVVRDKLMRYVFPDTAPTATSAVEARGGASIANPPTVRNSSATAGVDNAGISVARAADGPTLFNDYTFGAVRTQDGFHPRVETPNGQRIYRDVTLPSRAEAEAAGRSRVLETVARPQNAAESQFLNAAGIPGIKYLDQGSRGAGEGSRNYVVFDDKLVEIMKKYGLVGPIGAGIAAKILSRQEQRQEF